MPSWLLKLAAVLMTGLAALGSANYVSRHVKSDTAPLRPPVITSASALAGGTGGHLNLKPSVQSSDDLQPITFTSVS
jgi:hypothetical protein